MIPTFIFYIFLSMKKNIAIALWVAIVAIIGFLVFRSVNQSTDYTWKRVSVDYVGTFPDGKVFDTSIEKVAKDNGLYNPRRPYVPLQFTVWGQEVIKWFSDGVEWLKVWETQKVTVEPKDGYGEIDPSKVSRLQRSMFQQANIIPTTGQAYQIGWQIVTVKEILENEVIVDANHPMAGKTLIFEITLKSVEGETSSQNSKPKETSKE